MTISFKKKRLPQYLENFNLSQRAITLLVIGNKLDMDVTNIKT